ncbi:Ionotropic receptor 627 [Blattella germanica]|nr:Ionotropic receptor 627 [Blattella germanica]
MENILSLVLLLLSVSGGREINTVEYKHIVSCVEDILHRDFKNIHPVVVSVPEICRDSTPRALGLLLKPPKQDHQQLVDELLKTVSNFTLIQMRVPSLATENEYPGNNDQTRHRGYIFLIFSCNADEDSEADDEEFQYILDSQINVIMEKLTFNAMAKFIVILPEIFGDNSESFALALTRRWWNMAKMVNFIILLPHSVINIEEKEIQNGDEGAKLDLYSWSPYIDNNCDAVDKVILLDQWLPSNRDKFLKNTSLYNFTLPTNFHGCPLNVATFGPEPYVIADPNYTMDNGVELKDVNGLSIHVLYSLTRKYNLTLNFILHKKEISGSGNSDFLMKFLADEMHVIAGTIFPMITTLIYGDMSNPIVYDAAKYIVPCPTPIGKMWRILKTFTSSTWAALIVVLFLASFLTQLNSRTNRKEYNMFTKFPYCLYSNWAVLLGISTPQIPFSSRIRQLFILYVWYCFAINQVFQAYFVTYLVEPGYGKSLETLDDLRLSKITYGWFNMAAWIIAVLDTLDFKTVAYSLRECIDVYPCTEIVISEQNLAALTSPFLAWYIARKKGFQNLNKIVCFLEENLFTFYFPFLVRKGFPLLSIINYHILIYMQTGLQERYLSELIHGILLKADERHNEDLMYTVFTMKYLGPIFMLLIFGCFISTMVFIGEIVFNFCRKKML